MRTMKNSKNQKNYVKVLTVRDRDTMEQERVKIEDLNAYFENKFRFQETKNIA